MVSQATKTTQRADDRSIVEEARDQNNLDRARFRDVGRSKEFLQPTPSLLDRFSSSSRENGESPTIFGLSASITFGGPKTEFKVGVDGDVGLGLGLAKALVPETTKLGQVIKSLDPAEHLNTQISRISGWTHNPQLDARSPEQRDLEAIASRASLHQRWADAARREGFSGYDSKDSAAVNSTEFVLALVEPVFKEFLKSNPKLTGEQQLHLKKELLQFMMESSPYDDSKVLGGIKKLFRLGSNLGMLEDGSLKPESISMITTRLEEALKDLRAK